MSKHLKVFLLTSIGLLFAGMIFLFLNSMEIKAEEAQEPRTDSMTFVMGMNYAMAVPLPDSATFAGEPAPLNIFYVREQLDREFTVNTYWHSSTLLALKRSARWFPVIEPILKKNGIPEDFKYMALIESGLANVVSPAGAAGFWQFLEGTGRECGLIVNKEVDERYHVAKATEAACLYLNKAYQKFGNWTLVAAAYNAGQGRINDSMAKQQVNSYYHLYLSEETSRYIFRILAIKYIWENPVKYGFKLQEGDFYDPLQTKILQVTSSIPDLVLFARENKTTYRMLKELNPWLRGEMLTILPGKVFEIALPAE
jgi:membrane-bound lytic murein transglycosylase D